MRERYVLGTLAALAAAGASAQVPTPPASATPVTARALGVTPRSGTIVQRGQTVEFRLSVSAPGEIEHEYVLTRLPDTVVGRVVNQKGAAVIPFLVPPDARPDRVDFRATATPTAPALRRLMVVDTHLIVGPTAGGAPSPSPSPAPSPAPSPRPASP